MASFKCPNPRSAAFASSTAQGLVDVTPLALKVAGELARRCCSAIYPWPPLLITYISGYHFFLFYDLTCCATSVEPGFRDTWQSLLDTPVSTLKMGTEVPIWVMEPPPGEVRTEVNPPTTGGGIIPAAMSTTAIALVVVLLRIYTRAFMMRGLLGVDDCKSKPRERQR